MAEIDLKAYTARAVELETAIYTQKKLMEEHESILQKRRPKQPVMQQIQKPTKPKEPELLKSLPRINAILVSSSLFLLGAVLFLGGIFWMIVGVAIIAFAVFGLRSDKEQRETVAKMNKQKMDEYEAQCKDYEDQKTKYAIDLEKARLAHREACDKYDVEVSKYDNGTTLTMEQHNDVLMSLQKALSDLYAQDVVYAKYRNLVAITTINEYLQSGRCSELEGHGGAYNLYEMELRQNIVINQLSSIVSNLEQIRDNQFALYQELAHANATVNNILYEIKQVNTNTKLTAYFAGVTALIEATPKVYISRGYIH